MRHLETYADCWNRMQVLPQWVAKTEQAVAMVRRGLVVYAEVERQTGVPWVFTGLVHLMESECSWDAQILNGESWRKETTLEPAGRGPWASWADAAVDGLRDQVSKYRFWPLLLVLRRLEAWNGPGYEHHGVQSPYLWSGSNIGEGVGKYTADGQYDPNAASEQVGAALVLRQLVSLGLWREAQVCVPPLPFDEHGELSDYPGHEPIVRDFQRFLRRTDHKLIIDGWAGQKTSAAMRKALGHYLAGDPRETE